LRKLSPKARKALKASKRTAFFVIQRSVDIPNPQVRVFKEMNVMKNIASNPRKLEKLIQLTAEEAKKEILKRLEELNLKIVPEQIKIYKTDLTVLIPSDIFFDDQYCDKLIDIEYELRKKFPILYINIVPEATIPTSSR